MTVQTRLSRRTTSAAHVDVEQVVGDFVETITTLEDVLFTYYNSQAAELREAKFERRAQGAGGNTWMNDVLDCYMFDLE